jgi:hypothetical protein
MKGDNSRTGTVYPSGAFGFMLLNLWFVFFVDHYLSFHPFSFGYPSHFVLSQMAYISICCCQFVINSLKLVRRMIRIKRKDMDAKEHE